MFNNITLIQNYACFDKNRVSFVLDNLQDLSSILSYFGINSLINYNTNHFFEPLRVCHEKILKNVKFENNLGEDWCEIIENLLVRVNTEYVMCLCEDFFYLNDVSLWESTLQEAFVNEKADYLHLGQIHKHVGRSFAYQRDFCRYYTTENTAHRTIALDGIHKTSNLLAHIRAIKNHYVSTGFRYSEKMFHPSRINFAERYSGEKMGGFDRIFETSFSHFREKKYLSAWPKNMIITHAPYVQGLANHNFSNYTPKNQIALDFLRNS